MKPLFISIIFLGAVTACSQSPHQAQHAVDHFSLVRSAVYTQRELINTQLNRTIEDRVTETEFKGRREQLLIGSYCDLIDRRIIYSRDKPTSCDLAMSRSRQCLGDFHRCFKNCDLRSQACRRCEDPALTCLDAVSQMQH